MTLINENFLKLQAGYLFPEIGKRRRAFQEANPDAKIISMGIGDVTQPLAQAVIDAMKKAFRITSSNWRGIGRLPYSAYKLRDKFKCYDANLKFNVKVEQGRDILLGCECHLVIIGKIKPDQCQMFMKACTPQKPVGACMVSSEGTCRVWATTSTSQ